MRDQHAIWIPSPNMWTGRGGKTPRYIILHGTAGTAQSAVSWFQTSNQSDQNERVSAHYLVCMDGRVIEFVDENDSAWANGAPESGADSWWLNGINPNLETISIEHERPDTNNATPLTQAQIQASFELQSRIIQRWHIAPRWADASGGITGHFSINPINRAHCPGVYPWNDLFNFLHHTHGETTTMLSITDAMGQFFEDKGNGCWYCKPTGVNLIGSNLDYYRKHEGAGGLPLTVELELSQYPGTRMVLFEKWIQVFDPSHKIDRQPGTGDVYLVHINSGIGQQIIAKPLVQILQKEVDQLKAELAQPANTAELETLQKQVASYQQALEQILGIANKAKS